MKSFRFIKVALPIAIAIALVSLTSCGTIESVPTHQNLVQNANVVLSKKNFKVVGTVTGESTQTYIFGIGGLSKEALRESAMSDMYNNADLKGGARAIIYTNVYFTPKFYLVVEKWRAVAQGTVIEFTD